MLRQTVQQAYVAVVQIIWRYSEPPDSELDRTHQRFSQYILICKQTVAKLCSRSLPVCLAAQVSRGHGTVSRTLKTYFRPIMRKLQSRQRSSISPVISSRCAANFKPVSTCMCAPSYRHEVHLGSIRVAAMATYLDRLRHFYAVSPIF